MQIWTPRTCFIIKLVSQWLFHELCHGCRQASDKESLFCHLRWLMPNVSFDVHTQHANDFTSNQPVGWPTDMQIDFLVTLAGSDWLLLISYLLNHLLEYIVVILLIKTSFTLCTWFILILFISFLPFCALKWVTQTNILSLHRKHHTRNGNYVCYVSCVNLAVGNIKYSETSTFEIFQLLS